MMPIYLGNGCGLVTAMLGKTTKAVRVYFNQKPVFEMKQMSWLYENSRTVDHYDYCVSYSFDIGIIR